MFFGSRFAGFTRTSGISQKVKTQGRRIVEANISLFAGYQDAIGAAISSTSSIFDSIRQRFVVDIHKQALQTLHNQRLDSVVADGVCLIAADVACNPSADSQVVVESFEKEPSSICVTAGVAAAPCGEGKPVFQSFEEEIYSIVASEIAANPLAKGKLEAIARFMTSGVVERAELVQKYVVYIVASLATARCL
jgi:hypothetical protein